VAKDRHTGARRRTAVMTDDEVCARWAWESGLINRLRDPAVRARIRLMFGGAAEDKEPMACHNCGATLEQCIADPPCCRTTPGKQGCLHGGDPIEQNEESTNND
jgi:hypothetical protein